MIFLDNASTTRIDDEVNELIFNVNSLQFYNPAALYKPSLEIANRIEEEKMLLCENLGCNSNNLFFTSGATEANNSVIKGFLTSNKQAEYVFSVGEHPSVYEVANNLKNSGYIVHFVNLTQSGQVDIKHFKSLLNKNTHFISIMHVSNETGAINDIKTLCKLAKSVNPNVIFHSDGVQAVGKIKVNLKDLGIDAYSISAHKFYGPKGVGALFIKNLNKFKPLLLGGGQQLGVRSGTENVSGSLGLCFALNKTIKNLEENYNKINGFRKHFITEISNNLINFSINGKEDVSPYILSVSFKNLKGEVLLHMLEDEGVLIGNGSACSSKKSDNRVLKNMKLDKSYIEGSIRISFASYNTQSEIEVASEKLIKVVKELTKKVA